jgi:hypothetical protein
MPPIKSQSSKKAPKKKSQAVPETDKPVVYPELGSIIFANGTEQGPLTIAKAKEVIGWENEDDHAARVGEPKGSITYEDKFMLLDQSVEPKKIRCLYNAHNRPFDANLALSYAQDILNGKWELNCENIIISKFGNVTSGQHRLIALILAGQLWERKRNIFGAVWPEEPTMETFLAFGGSEEQKVLQTIDAGRSRTLADNYYSHPAFASYETAERRELGRMLGAAVELLWKRTGSGGKDSDTAAYQTHAASNEFLDRHGKLIDCVKHLFGENKSRAISTLHVSPGQCSASMYLMAASNTDLMDYQADRSENAIDFTRWDLATEFWALLAGNKQQIVEVREAMSKLVDEGAGGRPIEKQAIIARAWNKFVEKPKDKIKLEDVKLEYVVKNEQTHLDFSTPYIDFGGIDAGIKPEAEQGTPTKAQVEKAKKEEAKKSAEALNDKVKNKAPEPKPDPLAHLNELHLQHANTLIVVKKASGALVALNGDAEIAASMLTVKVEKEEGLSKLVLTAPQFEKLKTFCSAKGKGLALVEKVIIGLKDGTGVPQEKVSVLVAAKKAPAKPATKPTATKPVTRK